jgi:hypothetical protein
MTQPDPNDRADELLAMTQRLVKLLAAEIEAVKARRLDSTSGDWDEKERLVHAWRLEVSRVKAEPSLLAGVTPERKISLRDAAVALEEGLASHARALGAMKSVTEGLVRTIGAEIASMRSGPAAYGRTGALNATERREASGLAVDAKA